MRILITGCAGFIGSNAIEYFLRQGHDIIGIDALSTGSNVDNFADIKDDFEFCKLDLRDADVVDAFVKSHDFDNVLHLAAESHVDRGLEDDTPFWTTQVLGTQNLLKSIVGKGGSLDMVINQLTDELYGEVLPNEPSAVEGQPFAPNPLYACAKTAQYYVGRGYYKTYGLPIVSTFPVNNFGPRQYEEKLIPKFTKLLLDDKRVPLMTSSQNQRDWLPVIDMCSAFDVLLDKGSAGEDYNVGADNHKTNAELTTYLLNLLGKDESYIETVPDRKTHDSRYAVNSNKIEKLGWSSDTDFHEYLKHTVEWYKRDLS